MQILRIWRWESSLIDTDQFNKSTAQQRVDQIHAFDTELNALEQAGVLTLPSDDRQRVHQYHQGLKSTLLSSFDVDITSGDKQLSFGMRIASLLGALALVASVFFLFYQFWGRFSTTAQVVTLMTAPLVTLLATLWVSAREATGYFSKLAAMISLACFVLNIAMLGQIFNITPSDNALLVWAAFAFLLAYACDARLLLVAGLLCVQSFIAMRMGSWSGMYWLSFGERPENFILPALLTFAVPVLISQQRYCGFAVIYRVMGAAVLLLSVLVLSNVGQQSYFDVDPDFIEGVYQVLGFVLSALIIWLGIRKQWAEVVNTGSVFFILFLFTKVFDWWWDWMPKYLFFFVVGLVAVLALLVFRRMRAPSIHKEATNTEASHTGGRSV
jgi:uncharacterized membrane protein